MVEVLNTTRNTVLARHAEVATSFSSRLVGLLGREGLEVGQGLIIEPCNSIHTFFMRFSIDVAFVDVGGRIVGQIVGMKPWRMSRIYFRALKVVELPSGVLPETTTCLGDILTFGELE